MVNLRLWRQILELVPGIPDVQMVVAMLLADGDRDLGVPLGGLGGRGVRSRIEALSLLLMLCLMLLLR